MKLIRLLMALLLVLIPLPANAHDELVNQSPADGDTVQAGRVLISLDFNNELINLDGNGAQILVTGPEGNTLNPGCGAINQKNASLELELDAPGDYQVSWRVVSSDGHPINGEFGFKLVNETGFVADPNFQSVPCAEPILISEAPVETQDPFGYWLLWASLALVAVGVFFYLRPKGRR